MAHARIGRRRRALVCAAVAIASAVALGSAAVHRPGPAAAARLSLDAFIQQGAKLTASDEAVDGRFGQSVALSADGKTALIGGPGDSRRVGAAFVFTRSGSSWRQEGAKLTAGDAAGAALFGSSVALSADGKTALVGGSNDDNLVGAAWVFRRLGSTWKQQGPKLTGGGESGAGEFGESVALSADGNIALVGGPWDVDETGAAWVFRRSGSAWKQQGKKLTGTGETRGGRFGGSVALSADGSTAMVGISNANRAVGAAWVFTRVGSTWTQQGPKLTAGGPRDGFGSSVALSADGNTALSGSDSVSGAWVFTRSGSTWAQHGPKLPRTGAPVYDVALSGEGTTALLAGDVFTSGPTGVDAAAWVFTRSGSAWKRQGGRLMGKGSTGSSSFGGAALSADGSTALLGSLLDNRNVGAAFVFARSGSTWAQQGTKLTGAGEKGNGVFGASVALSVDGDTALIGGPRDDNRTGAAWVFTRSDSTWKQQGPKLTGGGESGPGEFGESVALSADGNTALVGGPWDVDETGAAWVFARSGSTWSQEGAKLTGAGEVDPAGFGYSVSLDGNGSTAVIGGPNDARVTGAAWVFARSGAAWAQQGAKLTGAGESGTGVFGYGVALSADGSTAVVGGPYDSVVGAAWVFHR